MCRGYYKSECKLRDITGKVWTVDPKILIFDLKPGEDKSQKTWWPEPHTEVKFEEKIYKGTFRSAKCNGMTVDRNMICEECKKIPSFDSFTKRLKLRSEARSEKTNIVHLNHPELLKKAQEKASSVRELSSKLFIEKSMNVRLRIRTRQLREKVGEQANRGNMKAIAHKLICAANNGSFDDKNVLLDTLKTVSRNLHTKKRGRRYEESCRQFYEVLLILGGPSIAKFVALNLDGPDIDTIHHWRRKSKLNLKLLPCKTNMDQFLALFSELKKKHNVPLVPVLTAEDETAVKSYVTYEQDSDTLVGFCGEATDDKNSHRCMPNVTVVIGDGEAGYTRICEAFSSKKKAGYARVILLNPLHPVYPRVTLLLQATCNKFTSDDVKEQWDSIESEYRKNLEAVVGPLIGQSSDGDRRRRKLMLQNMSNDTGDRFRPIPKKLGFTLSARKEVKGDKYIIRDVGDQDCIHQGKKLINPLDHSTRTMMMGDTNTIHMNHLQLLSDRFDRLHHGLTKTHILRKDRQNWKVAQELAFLRVHDCLKKMINGTEEHPPLLSVKGTLTYLEVVWMYIEVFFSPVATLRQRIVYSAAVIHFLGIWRNFIHHHKDYQLKSHFITRECYQDALISCHFSVILICFMRDNFPDVPCRLDLSGSDCCESFFSSNGQWVGNHHSYSFSEMKRNVSHMTRLDVIKGNPEGPKFSRAHKKQETVWEKQYGKEVQRADLTSYPAVGDEVEAWKEGMEIARNKARLYIHTYTLDF